MAVGEGVLLQSAHESNREARVEVLEGDRDLGRSGDELKHLTSLRVVKVLLQYLPEPIPLYLVLVLAVTCMQER